MKLDIESYNLAQRARMADIVRAQRKQIIRVKLT